MKNWSVLAVDQSMSHTGWAHMKDGDAKPTWGVRTMPSWKDREGEMLWGWFSWLGELLIEKKASHLFLENTFNPAHHEDLTQKIAQYGQIGMADAACYLIGQRHGTPVTYRVISSGQWRSLFLGAEKAPKGLVGSQKRTWLKDRAIAACLERGWIVDNDNSADALGIMSFGIATISPTWLAEQGPLFRRAESAVDAERRGV